MDLSGPPVNFQLCSLPEGSWCDKAPEHDSDLLVVQPAKLEHLLQAGLTGSALSAANVSELMTVAWEAEILGAQLLSL